jgi:hypothetical protein
MNATGRGYQLAGRSRNESKDKGIEDGQNHWY